jgi:hypothetical protein
MQAARNFRKENMQKLAGNDNKQTLAQAQGVLVQALPLRQEERTV